MSNSVNNGTKLLGLSVQQRGTGGKIGKILTYKRKETNRVSYKKLAQEVNHITKILKTDLASDVRGISAIASRAGLWAGG